MIKRRNKWNSERILIFFNGLIGAGTRGAGGAAATKSTGKMCMGEAES